MRKLDIVETAMVNHVRAQAKAMQFEDFANWFIINLILKEGNREFGMGFHKVIGCKNDTAIIYKKLITQ